MSGIDSKKSLDKRMSLKDAIAKFVFNGCSISFSGMGGEQVVAPTYEIIRQGQKDLTLIGDSPCEPADFLIGTGQIKRVEVAWIAFAVAGVSENTAVRWRRVSLMKLRFVNFPTIQWVCGSWRELWAFLLCPRNL